MRTVALIILGTSLMYTGLLVYESEFTVAVIAFAAGVVLIAKPVLAAIRYFGLRNLGDTVRTGTPKASGLPKAGRKARLRVVKPRDDEEDSKPTIH